MMKTYVRTTLRRFTTSSKSSRQLFIWYQHQHHHHHHPYHFGKICKTKMMKTNFRTTLRRFTTTSSISASSLTNREKILNIHDRTATCRNFTTTCAKSNVFGSDMNIKISPDVSSALSSGQPVVALESTILSHGMPYPRNLECAMEVESVIRSHGAVPATIAILDGQVHVGLSKDQLEHLADTENTVVKKCSTKDLPFVISQRLNGATTVAATMRLANLVGIDVFVTGGIGGVHREAESSMDISADLTELSRTPVAVVCAGVKSILDIPRTLEVLETNCVPVVTFQSDEFPCFFSSQSGVNTPERCDSESEIASVFRTSKSELKLESGMVVAVPPPHNDDHTLISDAIETSLSEAKDRNIKGKEVTPFLLDKVNRVTEGRSLEANVRLILRNAEVGAKLAVSLSSTTLQQPSSSNKNNKVVVIGGSTVDIMATSNESELRMYTSNPGHTKTSFGGVARNISEAIARLGHAPLFLSAVADDPFGETLRRHCIEELNMSDRGLRVVSSDLARTGMYVALFDKHGDLQSAVADADIAKNFVTSEFVRKFRTEIENASVVVVDANLCETTLSEIGDMVTGCCWLEPTSVAKAASFVRAGLLKHVSVISPNEDELDAMFREITHTSSSRSSDVDLETKSRRVLNEMKEDSSVVVTLGEQGVAIMSTNEDNMSYFEPGNVESIKNCTGAGDTLVGATVWAMAHRNLSLDDAVRSVGMRAAERTLASEEPVCPTLSSMEETGLFF